jgi:glycosyltransferase involved in cell wall biosynthesis
MRIGIDARLIAETGVGRYTRNLIRELQRIDCTNEYVVFLRKSGFDGFVLPNKRWRKVLADIPWHTVTEQILMPGIFQKENLDLLHVPYFNVPLLYRGPFVVTVHDLTIMHFDTGKASTHAWALYKLRRLGYRVIVRWGILHAKHLIAVSQATKKEILDHFPVSADKITVTHEGVDENFQGQQKPIIGGQYFLYVGNAYPHKNLETLLVAFERLKGTTKLVLVGKDDFFYRRIRKSVEDLGLSQSVVFFGAANDTQLASLYQHARALVFPSLMEGFGLPALEAVSFGCPVVCSDIPVFHELLGDDALYFDPANPENIAQILKRIMSKDIKEKREPNTKVLSRFSWKEMAQKTIHIYERSLGL